MTFYTGATLTIDSGAAFSNAGTTALTGALSNSAPSTLAEVVIGDEFSLTPNTAYSALAISSEILPTDSFYVIVSTGDNVSTATPQISTTSAASGQIITILNSGTSTYTFGDNGSVSGSLLTLGDTARALGQGDILKLIYYSGTWYEIGYFDN